MSLVLYYSAVFYTEARQHVSIKIIYSIRSFSNDRLCVRHPGGLSPTSPFVTDGFWVLVFSPPWDCLRVLGMSFFLFSGNSLFAVSPWTIADSNDDNNGGLWLLLQQVFAVWYRERRFWSASVVTIRIRSNRFHNDHGEPKTCHAVQSTKERTTLYHVCCTFLVKERENTWFTHIVGSN